MIAAPSSRCRGSCSGGSAAAILPSASIARARTSAGPVWFFRTAINAFAAVSDSISPRAKAAMARTLTSLSFSSSGVSALTASSLPMRPAASAARLRIDALGLERRVRSPSSQRRSSSALTICRSVAGGTERFWAKIEGDRASEIRSAQVNLLGIGDESYIRQDYRINRIYKKKGWPLRGPPPESTVKSGLVHDAGRRRNVGRLRCGVCRNRLHPRRVERLFLLHIVLRLVGSLAHLQHFASTFEDRALFDDQRWRLNVALYFRGAAQFQPLR